MARITKYLLLALVVAVAFNHAAKAQETEEAAVVEEEVVEPAVEEGGAEPAVQAEGEGTVGSPNEGEEQNFTVGSIKKIGSWLSKFGWWNIWKGIGLKEAGDWWKWDKIFKEDWWKKKWFLLGSRFEGEESRMMLVLSDPEARSMGVNADEEDATYFLAPPGFENELAKRGIAVNPSIVPAGKKQKQHQQRSQQRQPHLPHQLQKTHYTQPWLQRAFPSLDVYDREGGQGSEIDSIRVRPNMQSASRSMVTSLKQQIPDIIPLQSSALNTPMYAYDKNGVMQLVQQESPMVSLQQYQVMMNEETQNPAVLQEYQQARTGYQETKKTQEHKTPKRDHINSKTEPEGLLVPMSFPKSNSITTKEEIERALNDEHTQKMLEQYARKNWKTIRKDAIILKFVPKTDMEARPSVKRQATMFQEQTQMPMTMPRQMFLGDQLHQQVNSAYVKDLQHWAAQQERTMQDQHQQFRQITPIQMQTIMEQEPRQELPKPMMQHAPVMLQTPVMQEAPIMQQGKIMQQEPRQMIQTQQQMQLMPMIQQVPMIQQEPRQSIQEQTPMMMHQQHPTMQEQTPIMQQHTTIQQEPRQWLQEQPIMQQMPRQWIQEQPHQQPMMMQHEPMAQEPRQWVQEQQWMSVDPKVLDDLKPRQMVHQALEHTQNGQPLTETTIPRTEGGLIIPDETKLNNKDDQHPIVSEMGPQTEENARFFKKVLLKTRPSQGAHYVTHNYNIYSTDGGHGSGGYGSGYGAGSSYGGGASYGGGHNAGYESTYGGSYGGGHGGSYHSNHGAGYGGNYGSSYASGGSYGGSHGGGYRSTELGETPTATIF